jgi:diguanylate cyclase (GGDEF)-like protein
MGASLPLCDLFGITPEEIQTRLRFLRITDADAARFARIRGAISADLDQIIREFHEHLDHFAEPAALRGDRWTRQRLEAALRQHLTTLGDGYDTQSYFERRLRVGTAHQKIGLRQKWYLGADTLLGSLVGRRLTAVAEDAADLTDLLAALDRILTLDAILAVETYHQAATEHLERILSQLSEAQETLQVLSRTDGLTQVLNRRALMESLQAELVRSARFEHPCAILMVDIDHFKQVNDRFGHLFGDTVIRGVVREIKAALRNVDVLGRYGGEEFAAALVEVDEPGAQAIAERVRLSVASCPFEHAGESVPITVSIGVATFEGGKESVDEMIARADAALYRAKNAGRNRVVCWGSMVG